MVENFREQIYPYILQSANNGGSLQKAQYQTFFVILLCDWLTRSFGQYHLSCKKEK